MLGERVRQARLDAAMTQEMLSELTGLRQFYISRIEKGAVKDIKTHTLSLLTNALQVSADYLLGNTDEPSVKRIRRVSHG